MTFLIDTNALIRITDLDSPFQPVLAAKMAETIAAGGIPTLAPQVIFESWSVLTRPKEVNGFGYDSSTASSKIREWIETYRCLDDPLGLIYQWLQLCETYNVRGKQAHDCRLVAWMELNGIKHLLTLNSADFARYAQVEVLSLGL